MLEQDRPLLLGAFESVPVLGTDFLSWALPKHDQKSIMTERLAWR
jgi:hypothetical protein